MIPMGTFLPHGSTLCKCHNMLSLKQCTDMAVAIVVYGRLDSILQCRYLSFKCGGQKWLFWAGWVLIESPLIFLSRLMLEGKKKSLQLWKRTCFRRELCTQQDCTELKVWGHRLHDLRRPTGRNGKNKTMTRTSIFKPGNMKRLPFPCPYRLARICHIFLIILPLKYVTANFKAALN